MQTCEMCGRQYTRKRDINTYEIRKHGIAFRVVICKMCELVKDSDDYKAKMDTLCMQKIKNEGGIATATDGGRSYVHTIGENQYIPGRGRAL